MTPSIAQADSASWPRARPRPFIPRTQTIVMSTETFSAGESLITRGVAIASHLERRWVAEPRVRTVGEQIQLTAVDGRRIWIRSGNGSYKKSEHGRLFISPVYPLLGRYLYSGEGGKQITVPEHRTEADIAAAIARRLLPDLLHWTQISRERQSVAAAQEAARDATLGVLLDQLAPAHLVFGNRIIFGSAADPVHGQVRVRHNGSASLELKVADSSHLLALTRILRTPHHEHQAPVAGQPT